MITFDLSDLDELILISLNHLPSKIFLSVDLMEKLEPYLVKFEKPYNKGKAYEVFGTQVIPIKEFPSESFHISHFTKGPTPYSQLSAVRVIHNEFRSALHALCPFAAFENMGMKPSDPATGLTIVFKDETVKQIAYE